MLTFLRTSIIPLLLLGLIVMGGPAPGHAMDSATEQPVGRKVLDVAVVRPLTMIGAWAGTGIFFATLPLTFLTGVGIESATYLVVTPWRFTSGRPIGDFHSYHDGRTATGRVRPE